MSNLATVLWIMCGVIVGACGVWALQDRLKERHRARVFAARLDARPAEQVPDDVQAGLDRLWAAVDELHRGMEARERGELS